MKPIEGSEKLAWDFIYYGAAIGYAGLELYSILNNHIGAAITWAIVSISFLVARRLNLKTNRPKKSDTLRTCNKCDGVAWIGNPPSCDDCPEYQRKKDKD